MAGATGVAGPEADRSTGIMVPHHEVEVMVCGRRSEHGRNGVSGHDQLQPAIRGVGVKCPPTDVHHIR